MASYGCAVGITSFDKISDAALGHGEELFPCEYQPVSEYRLSFSTEDVLCVCLLGLQFCASKLVLFGKSVSGSLALLVGWLRGWLFAEANALLCICSGIA